MTFWQTDLGPITGDPKEAYATISTFQTIPNDTHTFAKIESFKNKEYNGSPYLQIEWTIIEGEFKNRRVFQKLHVFDPDNKKRHRFLNMLMLLHKMYNLPHKDNPPADEDLMLFETKIAGIKIQETEPNSEGKQYNWVSQIHPAAGFVAKTGQSTAKTTPAHLESALTRNHDRKTAENTIIDNDIPF